MLDYAEIILSALITIANIVPIDTLCQINFNLLIIRLKKCEKRESDG